jgi:APA family basic amino acid/polyamine antiporter
MNLFRRKTISQILHEGVDEGHTLKRTLGRTSLILLGIGAIIGAGLFSITGGAAANNAGAGVTISFIIAAVACAFAGFCYAEFASMIPVAGSAYTYSYATMGEFIAWIIGWDLVLEYAVGAATVAISWSRYLVKFLGYYDLHLAPEMTMSPWNSVTLESGEVVHGIINLPSVFIVVAMSLLLMRGTKESALVNTVIVSLKVAVVLIFIALGWAYINTANYVPYIPDNTGEFGSFGWSGVLRAAGIIFFAYIGFDAVSTAAQEAKNPEKDMPWGIIGSLVVCTILYLLFAHVMTGVANYKDFQGQDGIAPVAVAIDHMGTQGADGKWIPDFPWLNKAIIVAILAGYSSVIMVMLMGQSRVFYTMSKDGLLPKIFSDVHPKFQTPVKSNLLFMGVVSLFAAFVPADIVGEMTSIGTLLAFVLVCAGVLVMRYTQPDAPRSFKTPFVPFVPALGILCCLAMMISLPWDTWLRLIGWLALGFIIYFVYSYKNSRLNK